MGKRTRGARKQDEGRRLLRRMAECAARVCGERRAVEFVTAIGLQPRYKQAGLTTMWLLTNPVPSAAEIYPWTTVSPSFPEFAEVIANRMGRGYLPIGIMDVKTGEAHVFADVVPAAYQEDYVAFARAEIQITYDTFTGKASPEDSWIEGGQGAPSKPAPVKLSLMEGAGRKWWLN